MNDQNPPNNPPADAPEQQAGGEQQAGEPQQNAQHDLSQPVEASHDLQPPQPTPPAYAPPPHFGSSPQYASPPQQNQAWAQAPQQFAPGGQPQQPQFAQPQAQQQPQPTPQQPEQFVQQQPQYAQPGQPQPGQFVQQPYATAQQAQPGQPYAQPQQYAPGQPQQQPHPGPQYAPGMPPTGAPPRKGLPVGAWIGIGAGALVLLLLIVLGIGAAIFANRPADPLPAPPPTEVPEETETPKPSDEFKVYSLDETPDFSAGPFWAVPYLDGWDIVRLNEQGVNQFESVAQGCMYFTYQGLGPKGIPTNNDRKATEQTLETALQIGLPWTAATSNPEVLPDGSFEMPVDGAFAVEVQRFVANYPTADGERKRQILMRTLMPQNLAMYAEVDCPATASGDEAAQAVIDGLSFTEF